MTTITKYSKQREAIKKYLLQTKEHPTADIVYMNIRSVLPNISLGTVYRNLNLLAEQGEIIKINCQDGSVHFDGKHDPHYHFICRDCGKIFDIEMESIDFIDKIASANFAGTIEGHTVQFYGKCPDCK